MANKLWILKGQFEVAQPKRMEYEYVQSKPFGYFGRFTAIGMSPKT